MSIQLTNFSRGEECWPQFSFRLFFRRLKNAGICRNQTELANILKLSRAGVSYVATKRYFVPEEWKARLINAGINWKWVVTGNGNKFNSDYLIKKGVCVQSKEVIDSEDGPIVSSNGNPVLSLHRSVLVKSAMSNSFTCHSQTGNSMRPVAGDGDIWVVDLTSQSLEVGWIYLVKTTLHQDRFICIIKNIDFVNHTVLIGFEDERYGTMDIPIDSVEVYGRCALKLCKVV
jgi:hypothetical protein